MDRKGAWLAGLILPAVALVLYPLWWRPHVQAPPDVAAPPALRGAGAAPPSLEASGARSGGGPVPGHLTVLLHADADPTVLAGIARVVRAPVLGDAWRVAVVGPLEPAAAALRALPGVRAVAPSVDYGLRGQPRDSLDPPNPGFGVAGVRRAWEQLEARGAVGSRRVRVAVIGAGVDYTHPDLYLNIGINQGEIPYRVVRSCGAAASCATGARGIPTCSVCDVDQDGLISFADLNAAPNWSGPDAPCDRDRSVICDHNGNGFIDAGDLLADPGWSDRYDGDRNGLVDDLVGWNFATDTNDPAPTLLDHDTAVAGLIGALPRNGRGIAGVAWEVSLVPLAVAVGTRADPLVPDVSFIDAARYVEDNGVDIANASLGWELVDPSADVGCGDAPQTHPWKALGGDLLGTFDAAPWTAGDRRTLYVFAAGNRRMELGDPLTSGVVDVPSQLLDAVAGARVLIVGASANRRRRDRASNYGPAVDLYAPWGAWNTLTTPLPGVRREVARYSGTSMSAAVVTGAAALVAGSDPSLSGRPDAVAARLVSTPEDVRIMAACGVRRVFDGRGRHVDAAAALR